MYVVSEMADHWDAPILEQTMALAFFSKRCVVVMLELAESGRTWAMHGDGTHKLHFGRWVLVTYGTHALQWDSKARVYRHSFRPILYVLSKDHESISSVRFGMMAMQCVSMQYAGTRLCPAINISDFSDGLRVGMQYIEWDHLLPEVPFAVRVAIETVPDVCIMMHYDAF